VKLVRLKRPKATCSLSYKDIYERCRTNAAIFWDMGHTKGKLCKGGIGQGKENQKLKRG
jgi:hypothetical protein